MTKNRKILAFVHIEKAAGITFSSILDQNFTFKHCRVEPLKKRFPVIFDAQDMRIIQRINPFVEVISGHPVRPFGNLDSAVEEVKYITLLREPVSRYLSHYQFWVERMNNPLTFEEFLNDETVQNFQTKKIAGKDDLELAKKYLDDFFLVGVIEQFDAFLKVFQKKMSPVAIDINYEKKNIGSKRIVKEISSNFDLYEGRIKENNALDFALYSYAKGLFANEVATYSPLKNGEKDNKQKKLYLYKAVRKFYYRPLLKLAQVYYAQSSSGRQVVTRRHI